MATAVALGIIGCRDGGEPRPPAVHGVSIEPTNFGLSAGAAVQLRAVVNADRGADTTVRWTSDPSESGGVSPSGLLTSCYPPGLILVHATSVADPTKAATLPVTVAIPAVGWASVAGVVRPGTLTTIRRDSVTGDVELFASLSPGGILACRGVERLDVRVQGSGVDTLVARLDFTPAFSDARTLRIPLRSSGLSNGTYEIIGTVYVSGVTRTVPALGTQITVRNP